MFLLGSIGVGIDISCKYSHTHNRSVLLLNWNHPQVRAPNLSKRYLYGWCYKPVRLWHCVVVSLENCSSCSHTSTTSLLIQTWFRCLLLSKVVQCYFQIGTKKTSEIMCFNSSLLVCLYWYSTVLREFSWNNYFAQWLPDSYNRKSCNASSYNQIWFTFYNSYAFSM